MPAPTDESGPQARATASSLRAALEVKRPELPEDVQVDLAAIEELRSSLEQSREPVEILGYGAGNKSDPRSQEEAERGVVTHEVVGNVCRRAVSRKRKCLQLFNVLNSVRCDYAIELGTCLGISTAYLAVALKASGGSLASFEGAPGLARIAQRNLSSLGLVNARVVVGKFTTTLPDVLAACPPIGFSYIDGHHDGRATERYFEMVVERSVSGAVVVLDDIRWNDDMHEAWRTLLAHPSVSEAIDLEQMGVIVLR